jgi:pimeloyl-ACP methyl ester carboxylesterase
MPRAVTIVAVVFALTRLGCATAPGEPGDPESAPIQAVVYNGPADQFAGGFAPTNAPYGGFGGGACVATHTPVVFVHGNTVNASFFAKPSTSGAPSVYATLKAAGYNDCELFGVTYLSPTDQANQPLNYHTAIKARRIADFIAAVKAYTGKPKVAIVAHSMGVTVAQHGLTYGNLWSSVEAFINVAGGVQGLTACLPVGYANPAFPTCGSQNLFDPNTFGFWPDGAAGAANPRMGASAAVGFRAEPARRPAVRFYTVSGGASDEIVGGTQCKYTAAPALRAQLDVGIDHLASFTNTGAILATMLTTACAGTACCAGYAGACGAL